MVKNLIKSINLVELVDKYAMNFFNEYTKKHIINLTFKISCKNVACFFIKIEGIIDGKKVCTNYIGDDLIPILEIALRNLRNKSTKLNML